MKRREFIRLLGGAAAGAWAFPASAQQRPRISILHSGFPKRAAIHLLFEALGKLGYGDTDIDLLSGEGDPVRLKALVNQLGAQRPVVIIAITSPAAIALKEAKLKIPVVFASVLDPVGLGIVESFSHPGGDFTGVTYAEAEIGGKQLELLIDAIAGMTRAAVLWSASIPGNALRLESIRNSASTRGIEIFFAQTRRGGGPSVRVRRRYASESSSSHLHDRQHNVWTAEASRRTRPHTYPSYDSFFSFGGARWGLDVLRANRR